MSQSMQSARRIFDAFQRRVLIYNACCEDPYIDRLALQLQPADRVLVITSGGCNALDYLLAGAGEVNSIDINPCQNALLEFKVAAIRQLDYSDLWSLFGQGYAANVDELYFDVIQRQLSQSAREFWDTRLFMFRGSMVRRSFYYHGGWGIVTWILRCLWQIRGMRPSLESLFEAESLNEQWTIYTTKIRSRIWSRWLCWILSRPPVHALLGIPPRQRKIILNYPGGLYVYGLKLLDELLSTIPFSSNYFMRANVMGAYAPGCCPEYLTKDGYQRLKSGLLDQLKIHSATVTEYLSQADPGISKFVLLDHMDWLTTPELAEEWTVLLQRATAGATVIFRSASLAVEYLDGLSVEYRGCQTQLGELLNYQRDLAARLHRLDRVHLYGSFSVVTLP